MFLLSDIKCVPFDQEHLLACPLWHYSELLGGEIIYMRKMNVTLQPCVHRFITITAIVDKKMSREQMRNRRHRDVCAV